MTEMELLARLERLECDNRQIKRLGAATIVLAAALGAIYAVTPVPQKITAHEFDVVDSAGKVRLAAGTSHGMATIALRDAQGNEKIAISDGPEIVLFGDNPLVINNLSGYGYGPMIAVGDNAVITGGVGVNGKPNIRLIDAQGFKMDLGSTDTLSPHTGTTEQTSAASIVMFGNDKEHHVIWRAP